MELDSQLIQEPEDRSYVLLAGIFVALLACIVVMGCISQNQGSQKSSNTSMSNNLSVAENKTGVQMTNETIAAVLPDGTYENNVTYAYHAGVNTVDISVTVNNDIITQASVVGINTDPISTKHIDDFNNALPSVVVGKRIDQLNLPKSVAGSSLTTAAFNGYVNSLLNHQ